MLGNNYPLSMTTIVMKLSLFGDVECVVTVRLATYTILCQMVLWLNKLLRIVNKTANHDNPKYLQSL